MNACILINISTNKLMITWKFGLLMERERVKERERESV